MASDPRAAMKAAALEYHERAPHGKVSVEATKPCENADDLTLAYSPGVAYPCLEIARDKSLVYKYTSKGNLVAVISNGTAVLGLGNIGAEAGKPVMEGKGVLFKRFAGIDVFDIEITPTDPAKVIEIVKALEPTFGGVNLEDIKAPECFEIETKLKEICDIPIFHDDQHGTAVITAAGLINACQIQGKKLEDVTVTCVGAGASAIACMKMWVDVGVTKANITMLDSKGVIYLERPGRPLTVHKEEWAKPKGETRLTLADALAGCDVLVGLSSGGSVTKEMVKSMADKPIIFALANPDPEIPYDEAKEACPDAIVATGRSDFPNQVNNVLGFPFIFRGALDVASRDINAEMKVAAAHALAELAREDVPDEVKAAYGGIELAFGTDYIIPKPFDRRVLVKVSSAVAKAAMDTGAANAPVDMDEYIERLTKLGEKLHG